MRFLHIGERKLKYFFVIAFCFSTLFTIYLFYGITIDKIGPNLLQSTLIENAAFGNETTQSNRSSAEQFISEELNKNLTVPIENKEKLTIQKPINDTSELHPSTALNDENKEATFLTDNNSTEGFIDLDLYRSKIVDVGFRLNSFLNGGGHGGMMKFDHALGNLMISLGFTIIDSLTTMMLMNLTEELHHARSFVNTLNFEKDTTVNFFETTIRLLGGLLGAYDLSQDTLYLRKAVQLADKLLFSFNNTHGFPENHCNLISGECVTQYQFSLAEVGTFQLEFERLSLITGDLKYKKMSDQVTDLLQNMNSIVPGLLPTAFFGSDSQLGDAAGFKFTVGGMADSYYEYTLKTYLLNRKNIKYLKAYNLFVQEFRNHLVYKTPTFEPLFIIGIEDNGISYGQLEHLACFVPGLLALGYMSLPNRPQWELDLAKALTTTCYNMYHSSPSGLGPECALFQNTIPNYLSLNKSQLMPLQDYFNTYIKVDTSYQLRPETLESIFYLYRATKDKKYQIWAIEIFEAIYKHCKSEFGFSSVINVDTPWTNKTNEQPSYFFAETLKYLYLIFSPDDLLPLDKFVLNTEAHPLKIKKFKFLHPNKN